jgi:SAM-dependent methyltransferase
MRKLIIKLVLKIASIFKKNQKISKAGKKANIGCGLRCLEGWVNIDGSLSALLGSKKFAWFNKILYKFSGSSSYYTFKQFHETIAKKKLYFADLINGIPFVSESLEIIYCSHVLEHLTKNDGAQLLRECYRVLKKDGLLRLVVPDLDKAFDMYRDGKSQEMLDLFFYTSDDPDFSAHKYGYNFAMLDRLLTENGFKDIQKKSYRVGACPDIKFLDVYPEYSLYIECRK